MRVVDESITAAEQAIFTGEVKVITTKEDWIEGFLVSLNKENNSGTFRLKDGMTVRYRLIGNSPQNMYSDFAYRGFVRVFGRVSLDAGLRPILLEVLQIERIQKELFTKPSLPSGSETSEGPQ